MLDNVHLYIMTGILGAITPLIDKLNFKNFRWFDYIFLREMIFILGYGLIVYFFSKENLFKKISGLDYNAKNVLIGGSIISLIYHILIFYIFEQDFKKDGMAKVVITLMITTIIFSFLIDKFYVGTKFNWINYLGVAFLLAGIIFLKGF
tara:strand:- start:281 stop:727 length:447 start_codon:yes stop_codon:yes gene_type:complete